MSKNLIYTTHIKTAKMTDKTWKAYKCCAETQKLYADKIGADFYCQEDQKINLSDHGNDEKFNIYNLLDKYDRVLLLDADIMIVPDAADIFNEYPDENYVYMLNETQFNHEITMKTHIPRVVANYQIIKNAIDDIMKADIKIYYHNADIILERQGNYDKPAEIILSNMVPYYNAGVVLASKKTKEIFNLAGYSKGPAWYSDQDYINFRNYMEYMRHGKLIIQPLSYRWNGMFVYEYNALHKCHFLHYAGGLLDNCFKHCYSLYGDKIDISQYSDNYEIFLPYRMRKQDNCYIGIKYLASNFRKYTENIGVEIGANCGELSVLLAPFCSKLYCLDEWQHDEIEKEFDIRAGHFQNICKVPANIGNKESETRFLIDSIKPDFVYIHCNANPGFLDKEIKLWMPLLANDGYMCGSDENDRETRNMIQNNFGTIDGKRLKSFCDGSWLAIRPKEILQSRSISGYGIAGGKLCATYDDFVQQLKKIKPDNSPEALRRLKEEADRRGYK